MNRIFRHFFSYILIAIASPALADTAESVYDLRSRMIGELNVDDFTDAPLQIAKMARINMPPQEAFQLVSKGIDKWIKGVENLTWDHSKAQVEGDFSAGSSRKCSIEDDVLVENILYWKEGRMYAFNVDEIKSTVSLPPTKDRLNILTVEPDHQGGSLVTWRFYFNRKFHPIAPFVKIFMKSQFIDPSMENLIAKNGGKLIDVEF